MDARQRLYRKSRSDNPDIALPALVKLGLAQVILPTSDAGYRSYNRGRLFQPENTNLWTDPQGVLADGTLWPADTAHINTTANITVPIPVPNELGGLTKCVKYENDGTAESASSANITITESKYYYLSVYAYCPTFGGNVTITAEVEDGAHSFTLGTITGAVGSWTRYSIKLNSAAGENTVNLKVAFAGGTTTTLYLTGAQLEGGGSNTETVLTSFFCGASTSGSIAWTGTANASTSTRVGSSLNYSPSLISATAGTVAARTVPIGATSADSYGSVDVFMYVQRSPTNYALLFQRVNNSVYGYLYGGGGADFIGKTSLNWAANSQNHVVFRWTAASALDLNYNGTNVAQVATARTPVPLSTGSVSVGWLGNGCIYAGSSYIGPMVYSQQNKSAAWVTAIQANSGAVYSYPMTLWQDYLAPTDTLFPFLGSSTAYRKVA